VEADDPADDGGGPVAAGRPAGYLRTILTYNLPSEAEVDKAFLESNGIAACLLNANTSRNELGAPFFIRLQVMENDVENACSLIRQANPSRFGSSERVREIEGEIRRALIRFSCLALPLGIAAGAAAYLVAGGLPAAQPLSLHHFWVRPNVRVDLSLLVGLGVSVAVAAASGRTRK
jgi:hypothetical protein